MKGFCIFLLCTLFAFFAHSEQLTPLCGVEYHQNIHVSGQRTLVDDWNYRVLLYNLYCFSYIVEPWFAGSANCPPQYLNVSIQVVLQPVNNTNSRYTKAPGWATNDNVNIGHMFGGSLTEFRLRFMFPHRVKIIVDAPYASICPIKLRYTFSRGRSTSYWYQIPSHLPWVKDIHPKLIDRNVPTTFHFNRLHPQEADENDNLDMVFVVPTTISCGSSTNKKRLNEFPSIVKMGTDPINPNYQLYSWTYSFLNGGWYHLCALPSFGTISYEIGELFVFGSNPAYFTIDNGQIQKNYILLHYPYMVVFFGNNLDTRPGKDSAKVIKSNGNCLTSEAAGGVEIVDDLGPTDQNGISVAHWNVTFTKSGSYHLCYRLAGKNWAYVPFFDMLPIGAKNYLRNQTDIPPPPGVSLPPGTLPPPTTLEATTTLPPTTLEPTTTPPPTTLPPPPNCPDVYYYQTAPDTVLSGDLATHPGAAHCTMAADVTRFENTTDSMKLLGNLLMVPDNGTFLYSSAQRQAWDRFHFALFCNNDVHCVGVVHIMVSEFLTPAPTPSPTPSTLEPITTTAEPTTTIPPTTQTTEAPTTTLPPTTTQAPTEAPVYTGTSSGSQDPSSKATSTAPSTSTLEPSTTTTAPITTISSTSPTTVPSTTTAPPPTTTLPPKNVCPFGHLYFWYTVHSSPMQGDLNDKMKQTTKITCTEDGGLNFTATSSAKIGNVQLNRNGSFVYTVNNEEATGWDMFSFEVQCGDTICVAAANLWVPPTTTTMPAVSTAASTSTSPQETTTDAQTSTVSTGAATDTVTGTQQSPDTSMAATTSTPKPTTPCATPPVDYLPDFDSVIMTNPKVTLQLDNADLPKDFAVVLADLLCVDPEDLHLSTVRQSSGGTNWNVDVTVQCVSSCDNNEKLKLLMYYANLHTPPLSLRTNGVTAALTETNSDLAVSNSAADNGDSAKDDHGDTATKSFIISVAVILTAAVIIAMVVCAILFLRRKKRRQDYMNHFNFVVTPDSMPSSPPRPGEELDHNEPPPALELSDIEVVEKPGAV